MSHTHTHAPLPIRSNTVTANGLPLINVLSKMSRTWVAHRQADSDLKKKTFLKVQKHGCHFPPQECYKNE